MRSLLVRFKRLIIYFNFESFCVLKGGQHAPSLDQNGEIVRRESLTPPDENIVTWEEYINAEPGEYPTLGRQLVYKESSKTFRATVAMVSFRKPVRLFSLTEFKKKKLDLFYFRVRIFH